MLKSGTGAVVFSSDRPPKNRKKPFHITQAVLKKKNKQTVHINAVNIPLGFLNHNSHHV